LPSAAFGNAHTAKKSVAKAALPSAFYRALGKAFAKCPTLGKVQNEKIPKKIAIFLGGPLNSL
jgi:hypothetical protein